MSSYGLSDYEQERLDVYSALRAHNPHLPPPNRVTMDGYSIDYGDESTVSKMTLTVILDVPLDMRGRHVCPVCSRIHGTT